MKVSWTKGLNAQQKESMKNAFSSSAEVRARCIVLLKEKIEVARKSRYLDSSYENVNWAYKQADFCGYERALEEIISLLS